MSREPIPSRRANAHRGRNDLLHALIGPVFIALALWFVFGPDMASLPEVESVHVSREQVSTQPMRHPMQVPPWILSGGYELKCMDCHRLFPSRGTVGRTRFQHTHVVLEHGLNDRCLNCHDETERDRLQLRSGETVPFSDSPRLCADCHGTTWRDWQQGMHGRTSGYWDPALGTQTRLVCIDCHDPHSPAFPLMAPLPGPHTLRMGEQDAASLHGEAGTRSPLRQGELSNRGSHGAESPGLPLTGGGHE